MFDWNTYLKLAEDLIEENSSQEACRTSISRAYYSVYNLCKDKYLDLSDAQMVKKDSHKFIIDKYLEEKKVAKSIGHKLNTLKAKRVKSDYYSSEKIDIKIAKETLLLARKILDEDLILIDETYFAD